MNRNKSHIGILIERRYLTQAQPTGLYNALNLLGHGVTMIDPEVTSYETGKNEWLDGLDLVVGRGRSLPLFFLLAWAESKGVPTINRRAAVSSVHNKAEMSIILKSKNIATPKTFLGRIERLRNEIPDECYPLVIKPVFGDNCRGLSIVHTPAELAGLIWHEPTALAQSYLPNDGYDLKLYGIGREIWAVRKPSPLAKVAGKSNGNSKVELLPAARELEDLGRLCGSLFGLEFYGVDCIETCDGPVVIEINEFPNYTGVPDADWMLAEHLIRRAVEEGKK